MSDRCCHMLLVNWAGVRVGCVINIPIHVVMFIVGDAVDYSQCP